MHMSSFVDWDMYMRFTGGGVGHSPSAKKTHSTLNLNSKVEMEQFVNLIEARNPADAAPEEDEVEEGEEEVDDVMGDDSGSESESNRDGEKQDVDMDIPSSEGENKESGDDEDGLSNGAVSASEHESDLGDSDLDKSSEVNKGSDVEGDL